MINNKRNRIVLAKILKKLLLVCILLHFPYSIYGQGVSSIQLVGNFNGITCEPDDPENDMISLGNHEWSKLKFIDEGSSPPDTIDFKFTKDGTWGDEHWGWSFEHGWGIAELSWNPPSIVTALQDSGYHYFHFNDSTYSYSIERPAGKIFGAITSGDSGQLPANTTVTLTNSEAGTIGTFDEFSDSLYIFQHLPPAEYSIYASAEGYSDTTIYTNLARGDSAQIDITLYLNTAVTISYATYQRSDNEIILLWSTGNDCENIGFDIYRGVNPELSMMEKRNLNPIYSSPEYGFSDTVEDRYIDHYYYIVETNEINGVRYGPIKVERQTPYAGCSLQQNYPNPFNPSTTIPYTVGTTGDMQKVTISFFDVSGKLISSSDLGTKSPGDYTFLWNPSASVKGRIPSGVYYCRLAIGKNTFTRKMILLR